MSDPPREGSQTPKRRGATHAIRGGVTPPNGYLTSLAYGSDTRLYAPWRCELTVANSTFCSGMEGYPQPLKMLHVFKHVSVLGKGSTLMLPPYANAIVRHERERTIARFVIRTRQQGQDSFARGEPCVLLLRPDLEGPVIPRSGGCHRDRTIVCAEVKHHSYLLWGVSEQGGRPHAYPHSGMTVTQRGGTSVSAES